MKLMPATEKKVYSREMQEKVCRRRRRSERRAAPSSFFTAVKGRARLAGEKERGGGSRAAACRAKGRLQTGHTFPCGFLETA